MFAPVSPAPDPEDVERRMDSPTGPSMYVTRDCIKRIGLMDDSFFLYWEEVDWGVRAKAACGIGYAHRSVVPHISGSTTGTSRKRAKRSAVVGLSWQPQQASLRAPASPTLVRVDCVRVLPQNRRIPCGRIDAQFCRRDQGSHRRPARREGSARGGPEAGVGLNSDASLLNSASAARVLMRKSRKA